MSYLGSFKDNIKVRLKENELKKIKQDNLDKDKYEQQQKENEVADKIVQNNNQEVVTNNNQNINNEKLNNNSNNQTQMKEDPIEKLKEIDERIDLLEFYDVPETLGLEKKEKPTFNEEEKRQELIKILDDEKVEKEKEINKDFDDKLISYENEKVDLSKLKQENEKAINEIYDHQSLSVESQAIKRGLARSSIVINQLSKVESDRANKLNENLDDINNKVNNIENEINELIISRDDALKNLDLDYAEELELRLEESKNEYKKAVDEVIEFNNNVFKLESEYKLKYEAEKIKWKENVLDLNKYGYDEFRTKIKNAKYDYMISYLSNFSKVEALNILTSNPNFKDLLGEDYSRVYDYLINK